MALSYKNRRRLSLVVLIFGLPIYIAAAWFIMSLFERPSVLVEFMIYAALGILWAIPLKSVFIGVGQADPDAGDEQADAARTSRKEKT